MHRFFVEICVRVPDREFPAGRRGVESAQQIREPDNRFALVAEALCCHQRHARIVIHQDRAHDCFQISAHTLAVVVKD